MSIAILNQVYDEMRRLAIAGSVVASGDFRLQKLLAPLEQAGAKAPVFTKVAEAVKAVIDSNEKTSAASLLQLTTLVNAILYTQGETGVAGELSEIETSALAAPAGPAAQTSARVLKPLMEALTSTGSGRMELIKDAYERGAFRDLRLVKPALEAIDDVYAEIGEFIVQQVLPLYGKTIIPDLRAKFDLKGRGGHPRRLQLLHSLDPVGTRDLVKDALENGSKEVRVVAIECLGAAPEDLSYLIEQAGAKAQEVRQAAYNALANLDEEGAVNVLLKAMAGEDRRLAADGLHRCLNDKVLKAIIDTAEAELADLRKSKDKKSVGEKTQRLILLLNCLAGRQDSKSEAFLLKVFAQRDELAKIKGDVCSGPDLNSAVVQLMVQGTKKLGAALVDAQATLPSEDLAACFHAAQQTLGPDKVFDIFSPWLSAKADGKRKKGDPTAANREAILNALGQRRHYYYYARQSQSEDLPLLDPRWLDIAVEMEHLELVHHLIRPGHAAANAFVKKAFDAALKKAKHSFDCHQAVSAMVRAEHPEATDALIAVLEKFGKKTDYYGYWFGHLVVDLPKSAVPRLEALVPNLSERNADNLMGYLQQLREKL